MQIHVANSLFRIEQIRFVTILVFRQKTRVRVQVCFWVFSLMDEFDAANSFLMLPMAQNGLKWPVKTSQKPIQISKKHRKTMIFL